MHQNCIIVIFLSYNYAPKLVDLLLELNDTIEQLESKVNPLIIKVLYVLPIMSNVNFSY
jgi:hypothetical protein